MWWTKTALASATFVVAGWVAASGIASADPRPPQPQPKTAIDSDGTFVVGTDIVAGVYSSAGPVGTGTCYWKRLSSLNGKDIIDSAMTAQPQVVQIEASDTAFKTDGCQPWLPTDPASADGQLPAAIPPWLAQAQLRAYLDSLNGAARQFGGEQLPPP